MTLCPAQECDLVLKGGVTSGVVYPGAILHLSQSYRFRAIGGTSAGAIAAAITAAAELGRASGGFHVIAETPAYLANNLLSLFQPAPAGRKLFDFVIERIAAKSSLSCWKIVWHIKTILGGLKALPDLDYGLCPGRSQPGYAQPGLSDWLADTIDRAAGRFDLGKAPDAPLTFGDLWRGPDGAGTRTDPAIDLRMMTTNLSLGRPNALPFLEDDNYAFRETEFRRLFPDRVVNAMLSRSVEGEAGLFFFPRAEALPVVVATRMSLSFPLLIAAIPLYRKDFHPKKGTTDQPSWRRVLFSDGGLTSNLPIRFFDTLLPNRPTFALSLEERPETIDQTALYLPTRPGQGRSMAFHRIPGLLGFMMRLVNTAKDWPDQLQAHLVGYRERIVRIPLGADEGGLNLTMPPDIIQRLNQYGQRAGDLITGTVAPEFAEIDKTAPFDFDQHRWRRYLVAYDCLEELLTRLADDWGDPNDHNSFAAFVQRYGNDTRHYPGTPQSRQAMWQRMAQLAALGRNWSQASLVNQAGTVPKQAVRLEIVPDLINPP